VWDDGYRGRTYTYRQVAAMANSLRKRFRDSGISKGDAVLIWAESRPGWVAALWGCLLEGVVVVPVEPQSSKNLADRIAAKARTKIALTADLLSEIEQGSAPAMDAVPLELDDIAEIVFTSGTTAEPKGVVITHRNLLANLEPVAQEIDKYRKYAGPFQPLRILNLLPLSHLFGQSLALFIPPLIPVSVVFLSTTAAREIVKQVRARKISAIVAVP